MRFAIDAVCAALPVRPTEYTTRAWNSATFNGSRIRLTFEPGQCPEEDWFTNLQLKGHLICDVSKFDDTVDLLTVEEANADNSF